MKDSLIPAPRHSKLKIDQNTNDVNDKILNLEHTIDDLVSSLNLKEKEIKYN